MSDAASRGRPSRWIPASIIGIALVVALVVIALGGGVDHDSDSPEGVVQGYARAVIAGHHSEALSFLDPASGCTANDLRWAWVPNTWVRLGPVHRDGDRAEVTIVLSGPADPSPMSWSTNETLHLRRLEGHWLITGHPWPMYYCDAL